MAKKRRLKLQEFALTNFIPTVWSAQLLVSLKAALIYGQPGIVNTDYEGEISAYGDTVKITGIGAITVGDYTKNSNISDPEALTDSTRSITIDQAKYFNFQVDDVDKAQGNPKVMSQAMMEASYALKKTADTFVSGLYVDCVAENLIGNDTTPITFTAVTDAYNALVDLSVKLDEANVPENGRWVVVPSWYEGLMLKDSRFITAVDPTGAAARLNGQIGKAAGFNVLKSNQVPNTAGAKYKVIAGTSGAMSYAEQASEVEAYRPEKRFADAVKGLHLYGGKLVRTDGIAVLTVDRPTL